jgi:hypothetical protein
MNERYVTVSVLTDYGWTPADVRRACPQATEYTALDGGPSWLRDDLTALLGEDPDDDGR